MNTTVCIKMYIHKYILYTFNGSKHRTVDNENVFPLSSIVLHCAHVLWRTKKHETLTANQQKLGGVLRSVSSTTNVLATSISSPCCGFGSCTFEHDTCHEYIVLRHHTYVYLLAYMILRYMHKFKHTYVYINKKLSIYIYIYMYIVHFQRMKISESG